MKPLNAFPRKHQEAGVALLIAIFVLLLVSGVALALVANSGTESSLAGNYRSSTSAYDAGFAGLEEARGRLLQGSANYFNNTVAGFIPVGAPLAVTPQIQVRYILNPLAGEVVAPANPGNNATYPDLEFQQEFGQPVAAAQVQTIPSVWANVANIPGPLYKWVRITPVTEQSLKIDVNGDGVKDAVTPLYYDPAHTDTNGNPKPSLIVSATPPSTAMQALEVTALAVLPNGSRKIEQYVVTPVTYNLNFPSALSLPGSNVAFNPASSNQWYANGQDGSGNGRNSSWAPVAGCAPNPATSLPAVGVTDPSGSTANVTAVTGTITRPTHYTGGGLGTPSVGNVSLNSTLQTPSELNQLVQTVSANADLVLGTPPTAGNPYQNFSSSQLPATMSASNPATVVVNGNFALGPMTGYGLLIVTGNFTYSGNSGWDGIVLVIGSGTAQFLGNGGGNGGFNGAIFVATTEDVNYNLLPALGPVSFDINGGGGNGMYYDSCWIKNAQKPPTYQVLSFHEISQ